MKKIRQGIALLDLGLGQVVVNEDHEEDLSVKTESARRTESLKLDRYEELRAVVVVPVEHTTPLPLSLLRNVDDICSCHG